MRGGTHSQLRRKSASLVVRRRTISSWIPERKPAFAHNELTTLIENGIEVKILRHNMPFGKVAGGESGTYFIGYARSLEPLETMLRNMVIGRPPGNYDRLLDYVAPVTGTNFFAPSMEFLTSFAS